MALKASLAAINWQNLLTPNAPNTNMSLLHAKLAEEIDHFTPVKTHTVNPKKAHREPWLTTGIYISIRRSKKLYLETLLSNASEVTRTKYSNYAKQLQRVKRKAKLSYYEDKCRLFKHNTKKLWGIINEICKSKNDKSCLIDCLKINDVLEYDAKKITNKFGEYFSSVGKSFANKVKMPTTSPSDYSGKIPLNNKSLFMMPCSQKEISELIQKLPAKTSSGYDNISNVLLKDIGRYIVSPLMTIFNESLTMGIFPEVMKLADVVPLYKAKEKFLETNYRPISLLTTMSKILEKVVYNRVYKFLNDNDQLYENQYGFRNRHSCDNAVCDVVSHLVKNLESNKTSIALFLDLSKAFDTLDHDLLLHKMERYGLRGVVLDWFQSYLHGRKLRVKCKPTSSGQIETSAEFPIEYGAPQGSCLGPLLFLIFCNDLHLNLSYLHCVQFADDTTLLLGHKNHLYLKYCVESDLAIIQDWFNANKLTLNVNKSSFMIFSPNHKKTCKLEITLNGVTLPRTNNMKFLGTWIDEKLVWSHHLKNLRTKLLSKLGLLRKSKNLLSTHALKSLYYAQIHSNINYALVLWGPMAKYRDIKQIQSIQDKAMRCIETNSRVELVYHKHGILPLSKMILLELYKLGYKLINELLPNPLMMTLKSDHKQSSTEKTHRYKTRNKNIPNLPIVNNNHYRNSFLFKAIVEYSKLPTAIKQEHSYHTFVGKCKHYLRE